MSEIKYSEVIKSSYSARFDSFYFQKEFLENDEENFVELANICEIKSGTTPSDRTENLKEGIILLKTDNIRNGILSFNSENDYFFIDNETNKKMKSTELQNGDVLINIVGATTDVIGRCSLLSNDFPKANITQAMALLRIKDDFKQQLNSYYLFAYLTSKLGNKQIRRIARPTGQFNMNLQEVGSIKISFLSIDFQSKIKEKLIASEQNKKRSQSLYRQAEELLLETIGLKDFKPDNKGINIKNFKESFLTTGRLDAEYYQTKYEEIENWIKSKPYATIDSEFDINRNIIDYTAKHYNYMEIGDINVGNGSYAYNLIETSELPANAKIHSKRKDLLISKVRPNRGAISIIQEDIPNLVVSGAFTVLEEKKHYKREVLFVLLRTEIYRELLLKYNVGTSYPVIKDDDILNLPIPLIDKKIQQQIAELITQSFTLRRESERLLAEAKEMVEREIEGK